MAMIPARNRKRMQEGGEAEQTNVVESPYKWNKEFNEFYKEVYND